MRKHLTSVIRTMILVLGFSVVRARAQELELPQPLTSLLSTGAYITTGGLRLAEFTIVPPESSRPIDSLMLQQAHIHDAATSGFGGFRLEWGNPGLTTLPLNSRRELTLSFTVYGNEPSGIKEVNVLLAGQATSYAIAGATSYVSDLTGDFDNLRPIRLHATVPGPWSQSASRFADAGAKVALKTGVSLSIVAQSFRSDASAGIATVSLRLSNGDPRLAGDFDLNGHVDGHDFLLWQRTLGSQENLLADATRNSSVDAADYTIWRDNFGGQIGPPGDFDGDRDVDGADFLTWQRTFGSSYPAADANGNGIVDAADYTIWRDNFGTGGSSAQSMVATVPEPASKWLLLLGVVLAAGALGLKKSRR